MYIAEISDDTSAAPLAIGDLLDSADIISTSDTKATSPRTTFPHVYDAFAVVSDELMEKLDLEKRDRYLR
jgi:hypothetical protein